MHIKESKKERSSFNYERVVPAILVLSQTEAAENRDLSNPKFTWH